MVFFLSAKLQNISDLCKKKGIYFQNKGTFLLFLYFLFSSYIIIYKKILIIRTRYNVYIFCYRVGEGRELRSLAPCSGGRYACSFGISISRQTFRFLHWVELPIFQPFASAAIWLNRYHTFISINSKCIVPFLKNFTRNQSK